ncbi:MAG: HTH domain-containing protein [Candidatus Woesearchaeota archaeon]
MEKKNTEAKILKILLKQFLVNWTITSLSNEINLSRVGVWKVLKKLKDENFIILSPIGKGKTSIFSVKLNFENLVLEKRLSLILTEESSKHQRWINNFEELKKITEFVVLYGSVLHSPKEANDIDILGIVSNKNNFLSVGEIIQKIQKIQHKKIHSENFTKAEFKKELEKPNKIFIDAIKKGIILFGQEKFIKFIREVSLK